MPVTIASGDLVPSSGLPGYLHSCAGTHIQTHMHACNNVFHLHLYVWAFCLHVYLCIVSMPGVHRSQK